MSGSLGCGQILPRCGGLPLRKKTVPLGKDRQAYLGDLLALEPFFPKSGMALHSFLIGLTYCSILVAEVAVLGGETQVFLRDGSFLVRKCEDLSFLPRPLMSTMPLEQVVSISPPRVLLLFMAGLFAITTVEPRCTPRHVLRKTRGCNHCSAWNVRWTVFAKPTVDAEYILIYVLTICPFPMICSSKFFVNFLNKNCQYFNSPDS